MSSASNSLGLEQSVKRSTHGDPLYQDPETHRAALEGTLFATQNYYKSSVYSLGVMALEMGNQMYDYSATLVSYVAT